MPSDPPYAPDRDPAGVRRRKRRVKRVVRGVARWTLPALVLLVVGGYLAAMGALGVNPPVVAVQGHSMQPTLVTGDLVVLEGVSARTLAVGDVIALNVPSSVRSAYGLPAHVVHRIVAIRRTGSSLVFQTKGDNNPSPDPFTTPAANVIGEVYGTVPYVGYPLLFFGSRPGEIFLGAAGALGLGYVLLGAIESRRAYVDSMAKTLERLQRESDQFRQALDGRPLAAPALSAARPPGAGTPAVRGPGAVVPAVVLTPALAEAVHRLATRVEANEAVTRGTALVVRELVGAVSEYGEHLRSHTAAVQHLAVSSRKLEGAASRLADAVSGAHVAPPVLLAALSALPPGGAGAASADTTGAGGATSGHSVAPVVAHEVATGCPGATVREAPGWPVVPLARPPAAPFQGTGTGSA